MSGSRNETLYGNNVDFSGAAIPAPTMVADGQLLIGSTVSPNIRVGILTAGSGISITNAAGSITISASGGGGGITTINGDSGSVTGSTVKIFSDQLAVKSGSTVSFVGSGTIMIFELTDSSNNTLLGFGSGNITLSGNQNTGLGTAVLSSLTSGGNNLGLGTQPLSELTSGNFNIGIGNSSLGGVKTGSYNIALGLNSGNLYANAESNNILLSNQGVTGESNVIRIGTQGAGTTQQNQCFIAGINGNTLGGTPGFVTIDTSTGQLGVTSGGGGGGITTINVDSGSITGTAVNIFAHPPNASAGGSVSFQSTASDTAVLNLSDTASNTFLGSSAGGTTYTGSQNTSVGAASMQVLTSGIRNVSVGALSLSSLMTGSYNIAIGRIAGDNYGSSESSNIVISNEGNPGESNAIRIGTQGNGNAEQNTCFIAGITGTTPTNANIPQVVLCDNTGNLTVTPSSTAGFVLTSNGTNAPTFQAAGGGGGGITTLDGDVGSATGSTVLVTALGSISGQNCGSSVSFTGSGSTMELDLTDANGNTFIGRGAGEVNNLATTSVALGVVALGSLSTSVAGANGNTAIGYATLNASIVGVNNTGCGLECLLSCLGNDNTAVGSIALQNLVGTAGVSGFNTAIGGSTGQNLINGTLNTFLGYNSGGNYTGSESNNLCIAHPGTTGDNNTTRIGLGSKTSCFIAGIHGATVVGAAVLVSTTGQLGDIVSSEKVKENIEDISKTKQSILGCRPVSFNYKADKTKTKCFGMIAEEVAQVFPDLVLYKEGEPYSIKYHEMPALLLAEIQNLKKEIAELRTRIK